MSTGEDLALSHVGLMVGDQQAALEFYRDVIGLEGSPSHSADRGRTGRVLRDQGDGRSFAGRWDRVPLRVRVQCLDFGFVPLVHATAFE